MRPDFILHLDDKEDVIIDSKMTITSYDNYVHAKTDEERQIYAKEILTSIHNHIGELRRANYAAYIETGRKSADFVFMFIPNEGAMQVALAHEKNLWRDTFLKDRIFIVSEMNLYAALRIVNVTWRQIEQNKSYAKVFQTVGMLLDRLNGFIEKFGKIEKHLQQASVAYEEANHQLVVGSRSVLDTGLRLRDMGGIIVVDFIDMDTAENRQKLYERMCQNMSRDRAKHNILPLSKFGLMQITRQRVRPAMDVAVEESCPVCFGKGTIKASILFTDTLENKIDYLVKKLKISRFNLHVHPYVAAYINQGFISMKTRWKMKYGFGIRITPNQSVPLLAYTFYDSKGNEIDMKEEVEMK